MGLMHVTVLMKAPNRRKAGYTGLFLVDTGAIDSMVPRSVARKAGIAPIGRERYKLADGTVRAYSFGLAQLEFMGKVTSGRVIFGPETVEPILGVTALESAGIMVDPISQTLKRLPAISLK